MKMNFNKLLKNVIARPQSRHGAVELLGRIQEHVKNGGLFVFLPSGGDDESDDVSNFKSLLNHILRTSLPDEAMVYAIYIEPDKIRQYDMEDSEKQVEDRSPIIVKEHYSRFKDWREALPSGQVIAGRANRALSDRNRGIFGVNN